MKISKSWFKKEIEITFDEIVQINTEVSPEIRLWKWLINFITKF